MGQTAEFAAGAWIVLQPPSETARNIAQLAVRGKSRLSGNLAPLTVREQRVVKEWGGVCVYTVGHCG